MASPQARWDFRCNANDLSEDVIIESLKRIAKHWVFQEESGHTSGYLHYQGRMSLIKKARKSELMALWSTLELAWPLPNYLEPTSKEVFKTSDFSYVTKEDTRTRGPWTDKDAKVYIPRQYRNLMSSLYPYQRVIFESAQTFDTRVINFIYCVRGNIGKSTVASLCELFGTGIDLPPVNDSEKLIQSACNICMAKNIRNPSPFFVDLPRAMDKNKLYGIYSAIEQIKKGKLFDCRYNYTEWWIDSPQIWVFSNREPDLSMLSLDRWKLWTVDDGFNLVPYFKPPAENLLLKNGLEHCHVSNLRPPHAESDC